MRVLLVGNGFDLNFTDQLSGNTWRKNILYGKVMHDKFNYPSVFPAALINFWNNNFPGRELNINSRELAKIRTVLLSEAQSLPSEEIYNLITDDYSDQAKTDLEDMFKKYVVNHTNEIKPEMIGDNNNSLFLNEKTGNFIIRNFSHNLFAEKLASYDYIFTTKYDHVLEDFLESNYVDIDSLTQEQNEEEKQKLSRKVIHIHGSLDKNGIGKILLGDKVKYKENAEEWVEKSLKVLDNYSENETKNINSILG